MPHNNGFASTLQGDASGFEETRLVDQDSVQPASTNAKQKRWYESWIAQVLILLILVSVVIYGQVVTREKNDAQAEKQGNVLSITTLPTK
ncbi:MAG: hypothetical protein RI935_725 [Candidatus Parcubacteria bacterium]|jgi:hypothetical protein